MPDRRYNLRTARLSKDGSWHFAESIDGKFIPTRNSNPFMYVYAHTTIAELINYLGDGNMARTFFSEYIARHAGRPVKLEVKDD